MLEEDFANIVEKNTIGYTRTCRAPVYVGFQCHQGCGFCYYKNDCNSNMFSLDKIKRQVDFLYKYGVRDFELTGGEPGEHDDIEEACKYIKSMSSDCKLAVITNGTLCTKDVFNDIDEVLVSYHLSQSSQSYDKDMFPHGCTWSKVIKTVTAAKMHKKIVRTNTVVGIFNIDDLLSISKDLVQLQPDIINFLPVNLFEQSYSMKKYIDYSALRPKIKQVIDFLEASIPEVLVLVRYMPFCQMEGYEQHIVGTVQHIFDQFDWLPELSGPDYIDKADNNYLRSLGRLGSTSFKAAFQTRQQLYTKIPCCLKCKYFLICDGVEKTNCNELVKYAMPTVGHLEKNAMAYINQRIHQKYLDLYHIHI